MVRAWIAEGDLYIVLNIGFWEDPHRGIDERDAWGILMADMARHIADAHEKEYGRDPRATLNLIRGAFDRQILQAARGDWGWCWRRECSR
jgi:hypothetical protein